MSTDFAREAEKDIEEDLEKEGSWTRWGSRFLTKEISPTYIKNFYGTSMLAWKEKHHGG